MNKGVITFSILFAMLVLAQALLMNHIVLFNCAMCFLFIYFLIKVPLGISTNILLTLGFLLGLSVDVLSDTEGLNSLSCTILALLKRPVFYAYEQHDDHIRDISPGMATMGWLNFCKYLLSMSALFCLVEVTIEYATYASIPEILLKAAASSVFTFFVILAVDSLVYKK